MKTLALSLLLLAAPADKDPVVITAGKVAIRQSELEKAIASLPDDYRNYASSGGKKQFAEDYLRMKLLAAEGMKAGLDKDPAVVEQVALLQQNLVATAQIEKIRASLQISEADLRKRYEAAKAQYEQVSARHILVAYRGSAAQQAGKPELSEDQARAKAESIRKQLVEGAGFDALAKKESDDVGSGALGGDLGSFGRGQMVPEFEKAAFDAKPGELTPVVRTQYGYHVIRVDKHDVTPFEQVRDVLDRYERDARLQAALEKMRDDSKPSFDAAYFGKP